LWFLIDFVIYYKFLEFIIKRSKILSLLAIKYDFCCNYSKFLQKAALMAVAFEGSNGYLRQKELEVMNEVVVRSPPEDIGKNLEIWSKVLKEQNSNRVSLKTIPEKFLDAYKGLSKPK
jgi:hypothetical protein